jgi:hypothetical protein
VPAGATVPLVTGRPSPRPHILELHRILITQHPLKSTFASPLLRGNLEEISALPLSAEEDASI